MQRIFYSCMIVALMFFATGCAHQMHPADAHAPLKKCQPYVLSVNDKVTVSVWNNEDISVGSLFGQGNSNEVYGKWLRIDLKGEVNLPKLGKIKLEGMTLDQATDTLSILYNRFLIDPIVVVKVLNWQVSVLGEVNSPGVVSISKEGQLLSEVVARSGGFGHYAKKGFVKLIRTQDGSSTEYLVDMSGGVKDNLSSIYVQPGDIIMVPTKKGKSIDKKSSTIIAMVSVITTILLILNNR